MVLDRRKALVQALLRARNKKDRSDVLEKVAQTSTASGHGSYGEPAFEGTRFFSASQPSVTTRGKTAGQSHKLIPTPGPHPFHDLARVSYAGGATDMAKARGVHAQDQLTFKAAPSTLSWLANLQTSHGRPLGVYSTEPKPTVGHSVGKKGFNDLRQLSWGHDGTAKTTPLGHRAAILRLADSTPDMVKEVQHQEKKMPEIRYPTSGEIWSEFLGGIGKGIAQTFADTATSGAKARLGTFGGVYVDTPNPDLFGPPTSPWDDTGRKIAPGVMVVIRPVPRRPKTWNGKIIGKVTPPKHLKPGTVPFGNDMHEKIVEFLVASYPKTRFRTNVKRGQKGVDVKYQSGLESDHFEIKTNKPHSQKQMNRQIQNWGYEKSEVRAISYDEQGNIYDGFGD